MVKTACIVGASGQDGRLLQAHLSAQGYRLVCVSRTGIQAEGLTWTRAVDITHKDDVFDFIKAVQPDEVYHLATVHQSAEQTASNDLGFYRSSYEVNFFSLLHFLEAVRLFSPATRIFYAASSHIFGQNPGDGPTIVQNEATPHNPESVYAMTKVDGLLACRQYRQVHRVFASVGILFNHESTYRSEAFLTKKVVRAAVDIKRGSQAQLLVGNLSAEVDWGYAPDYVEAMHAMLSAEAADEFVVASGAAHSVRDFVEAAFAEVGISDWQAHVVENPDSVKRKRRSCIGDASKLAQVTHWKPKTSFREMVRMLIRDELRM